MGVRAGSVVWGPPDPPENAAPELPFTTNSKGRDMAARRPSVEAEVDDGVIDLRKWLLAASDMIRAVNADDPIDVLLTKISQRARSLLSLDMCAVMLADDAGRQLLARGYDGLSREYVDHLNSDRPLLVTPTDVDSTSPSVQAYLTGRIITIPDVRSAEGFEPWRDLAFREGYGALVAAPLLDGDRIAGVLVGYSHTSREFTATHLELLKLLADHAGTALESARLRTAGQSMIERLHVANAELTAQRYALEIAEDQHRRLMQVMANDVGVSGVVTMLAELLEASVALEDPHGNVMASAALGTYIAPPSGADRESEVVQAALAQVAQRRSGSVELPALSDGAIQFWIAPVTLGGEVVAYLWVGKPSASLDPVGRRGIERFALAVALEIAKQRSAMQVQLALSRDLVADILSEVRGSQRRVLLERAAAMGHDLSSPHTLLVAGLDAQPGASPMRSLKTSRLIETAHSTVRRLGVQAVVGGTEQELVILLAADAQTQDSYDAHDVAQAILTDLRRTRKAVSASIVVGAKAIDITEVADHFRSARGALRLLAGKQAGAIIDIEQFGVYALLLSHADTGPLMRFASNLLAPLIDRDARKQSDLIDTLRCWLTSNCSTSLAGEKLVVHTNTVIYRIKIIEELLGRSLRDQDLLTEIRLALMIHDVAQAVTDT